MISLETSNLLFFVTASFLLIIAPGPDIIFLVTQGVTRGSRAGFATAMGLAAGNLVHTTAAAIGVSVIFRASRVAFVVLKIAGVAYLLFLAWTSVRGSKKHRQEVPDSTAGGLLAEGGHVAGLFWRGFLMNIFNPKVALFFLAFLPQFASPHYGPPGPQMFVFGLMFTGMVMIVFGLIGVLSGRVGLRLGRGEGGNVGRWIVALVYIALAIRLATVR
jgi:threonine/homoserine/homoserine lactone efflux protein